MLVDGSYHTVRRSSPILVGGKTNAARCGTFTGGTGGGVRLDATQ